MIWLYFYVYFMILCVLFKVLAKSTGLISRPMCLLHLSCFRSYNKKSCWLPQFSSIQPAGCFPLVSQRAKTWRKIPFWQNIHSTIIGSLPIIEPSKWINFKKPLILAIIDVFCQAKWWTFLHILAHSESRALFLLFLLS